MSDDPPGHFPSTRVFRTKARPDRHSVDPVKDRLYLVPPPKPSEAQSRVVDGELLIGAGEGEMASSLSSDAYFLVTMERS
jgi:hypothetical protein